MLASVNCSVLLYSFLDNLTECFPPVLPQLGMDALDDLADDAVDGVVQYSEGGRSSLDLGLSPDRLGVRSGDAENEEGEMEDGEIVS
jgi:hypothetical protein